MLSPEELMIPRYKVIADYPLSPYEIGQICELNLNVSCIENLLTHFSLYPHLFRQLSWWEERSESDMPGWVKETGMVDSLGVSVPDKVWKARKHFASNSGDWRDNVFSNFAPESLESGVSYSGKEPAAETEYLDYINKQNP